MISHLKERTNVRAEQPRRVETPINAPTRRRGRPRGYDQFLALEAAMRAFWGAGYEATSMDTLCRVMNMPRASIYQIYGGKDGLFFAAIEHYGKTRGGPAGAALAPHGSLDDDLAEFFAAIVALGTGDPETPGCLVSNVLADAAVGNSEFRKALDQHFAGLEAGIAARLEAAGWDDDADCSVTVAAGVAAAAARGIMARARTGVSADVLGPVGQAAAKAVVSLTG
jgi:TetR/AcrR family transcriptional repressor of nem operon